MSENHLKSLGLDVKGLEVDLRRSVRCDERRWQENDAKLRAVEQKVASYDEFRNMVAACELLPLKPKEERRKPEYVARSSSLAYSIPKRTQRVSSSEESKESAIKKCNRADEFMRCWNGLERNADNSEKFALLVEQSSELLQEIFASSMGLTILSGILKCLREAAAIAENTQPVLQLLQTIGESKNFEITAIVMSNEERMLVKEIFHAIEENFNMPIDENLRRVWISL